MTRKRAAKVLLPERPLRTGTKELFEIHLRIPDPVEVTSSVVIFEGRCRSSFSGHDSIHTLISNRIPVPIQQFLLPTSKGAMVLAEGYHRLPMLLMLPTNLPGSFDGKYGAIAYRIVVKFSLRRFPSGEEAMLETESEAVVWGSTPVNPSTPSFCIQRHLRKKALCFNRLDCNVTFELDRCAFVAGEHILVTGQVVNNHATSVVKHVSIELRQKVHYTSGEAKKTDTRLITRLVCGSVAPANVLPLHHSIQIPYDCYPSLERRSINIQVSYVLLLTSLGNFTVEAPIVIGTRAACPSPLSITSGDKSSSVYYCTPPSEHDSANDGPPPYSTHPQGRPMYIPIHVLKTPYRPFVPCYSMHPMFAPPQYKEEPRFLKIEEITD
nr:Arrestin domain containing protein [Haemonchus contortus]